MIRRLEYLDCLRGMVMLMVVFCHTCGEFCLGLKDGFWVSRLLGILMLPGFFFVSGWFTHIGISGGIILKRLKTMMLPTFAMFLIYVFLYWGNMQKLSYCALGEYKYGYWFTFALFLINLIHWFVAVGVKRFSLIESGIEKWTLAALALVAVVLVILKNWDWNHNNALLANYLSLRLIAMYFPFYLLGIVCRYFEAQFHRLIDIEWLVAVVAVAFVGSLFHHGGGFYFGCGQGFLGIFLLYRFCYFYQETFSDKTWVGKQLSLIGRNTLPIYLLHYFFFLGVKFYGFGESIDLHTQWFLVLIVASILTICVTYASLAMVKVIGLSSLLSKMLIGK